MVTKIQFKNERTRVRSVKILEDILIQRRTEMFLKKKYSVRLRSSIEYVSMDYYLISLIISIPI